LGNGLCRKQIPIQYCPLYAKDAVLWGTLSPTVRSDPAGLKAYFVGAFQALPKATVKFGDQLIRVYGNTAVNTGYYTFSYIKDGETKSIPARYSFTYVKDGNDWKIVDSPSPDGVPDRLRGRAVARAGHAPTDTRSPHSGPRRSRFHERLAGMRSKSVHDQQAPSC
jgi:hypothetical protein